MGTPRKRKPSKRKAKPKRRRTSLLLIAGIAALIAGFLVRRSLLPTAIHSLTYRAPDNPQEPIVNREMPLRGEPPTIQESHKSVERPQPAAEHSPTVTTKLDTPANNRDTNSVAAPEASTGQAVSSHNTEGEHISASDRQQLDSILKRKP